MILIVGATGLLGGTIAHQLLEQGKDVRILVRENSPSEALVAQGMATPAPALIDAGAVPVYGDLKDRASLDVACAGIQTVITTANSAVRGGDDNVENVDLRGNRNLIEAARAAGVRHFIFVSANGAGVDHPAPFMQAKAHTEQLLRDSGMDYTILAPEAFVEVWVGMVVGGPLQAGRPVTLIGEGRRRHSFISLADVAAFAVAAVDNPAARNQTLVLGGPEGLSWRDIVARVGQVVGRDLPLRFVAPGEPVPGVPDGAQPLMIGLEAYDSVVDMTGPSSALGVELTPFEVTAARMFVPAPR